jgi:anti-repressor protein
MNDLIAVSQTDTGLTVDARELHAFLEVGRDFTSWIKGRIEKYEFEVGSDYVVTLTKTGERKNVTSHQYTLSLEMAKELCMVENNEKGREARRYFIACEKRLKSLSTPSYMIEDPIARAQRWIQEQQEKLMMQQRIAEYEPKVTYFDTILQSTDLLNAGQIAKDYGLSAKKLNQILKEEKVQYKINGQWLLYQNHAEKGYTKSTTQAYRKSDGSRGTALHTKWTQKGRLFIHQLLEKRGIIAVVDREEVKKDCGA